MVHTDERPAARQLRAAALRVTAARCGANHHHLACRDCGRIEVVFWGACAGCRDATDDAPAAARQSANPPDPRHTPASKEP